ncbi:MAG: class I adenylate cyclase [Thermodesulfobacteriota bacterium]
MKTKIERYRQYNEERITKATLFNPAKAAIFFKGVPYLLHTNYPDLPGFVENKECPCGIHGYEPEKMMPGDLFRKYFPTSSAMRLDSQAPRTSPPAIHSLKTIGSIGTVAQSALSDCDFWVSVRFKDLGKEGLAMLREKCKGIEQWALKRGAEVHFFLMDIDQTRENSFETSATDEESAGSAIKLLLKDELFRTHILVAGKPVLWWLIPPGFTEGEYRHFVLKMEKEKPVPPNDFVDLGYLSDIPKAEIFGACLWQMNKALDSPFKSVIKFAYLEQLLKAESNSLPLFSDRVKCLVTYPEKLADAKEAMDLAEVDPYLLLSREIVAFYRRSQKDKKWDNLIRECLFLKTLEGMESQKQTKFGQKSHLKATMAMMENWGLLPDNLEHFLQFRRWRFKDLIVFGNSVHEYLLETYKRLRWIFKNFGPETGLTITERDLSILGRKLFTFYEKKENKIEYIRSISRDMMAQEDITIHITKHAGKFSYFAFQGELDHNTVKEQVESVIRREDDLIKLVAWLLVNGILASKTRLHLTKNFLPIDLVDIQQLTEAMIKTFPIIHFSQIAPEKLVQKETMLRALVVVNFYKEPVKNAKTFHTSIMTENSYGEYFLQEYTTVTQFKNALRALLTQHYVSRWNNNLDFFVPPQDEMHFIKTILEK